MILLIQVISQEPLVCRGSRLSMMPNPMQRSRVTVPLFHVVVRLVVDMFFLSIRQSFI